MRRQRVAPQQSRWPAPAPVFLPADATFIPLQTLTRGPFSASFCLVQGAQDCATRHRAWRGGAALLAVSLAQRSDDTVRSLEIPRRECGCVPDGELCGAARRELGAARLLQHARVAAAVCPFLRPFLRLSSNVQECRDRNVVHSERGQPARKSCNTRRDAAGARRKDDAKPRSGHHRIWAHTS